MSNAPHYFVKLQDGNPEIKIERGRIKQQKGARVAGVL